jgi:hypothetical protein
MFVAAPFCKVRKYADIMSLTAHSLDWYRFIGRILGKALYEGILIDVAFAGFFLAKASSPPNIPLFPRSPRSLQWLGRQSFLDDLTSLDPELYQGLVFLKHYEGNPEDLSLNFTVAIEGSLTLVSSASIRSLACPQNLVWPKH